MTGEWIWSGWKQALFWTGSDKIRQMFIKLDILKRQGISGMIKLKD